MTQEISVIKRDGSREPLDISRIREVVYKCCEGLDCPPQELESHLSTRLRDGVKTREIQENLIQCAVELCSPESPDWRFVAGRLKMWSLWKDRIVSRGLITYPSEYLPAIKYLQKEGWMDNRITEIYSESDLKMAGNFMKIERDYDYDLAGVIAMEKRYLLPDELPQEAFLSCALLLASVEKTPELRLQIAYDIYQALSLRKISLATPILANLRRPEGNLTSCFITAIDDSLDSIFQEVWNAAKISKNGGGVGINLSRIRATGSWIKNRPAKAKGVVSWCKILNDTAIAVDQLGNRSGAFTLSLDAWHLDIPSFLELQTEHGDMRTKCFDIFPQLVIPDLFMERVKNNQDWTLFDPYEIRKKYGKELAELWGEEFEKVYTWLEKENKEGKIKLSKTVNAKDLFKKILRLQVESGLPYLSFKDTINRANPNKHEGYIPCTNLCVESYSNVKPGELAHSCNLISINLAQMPDNENGIKEYEYLCALGVRILDNTIDITHPPFDNAARHNERYRTIGIGFMGLADWLAKRKLRYQNFEEIDELFERLSFSCVEASVALAKERGAYPAFEGSEWSKGNLESIFPNLKKKGRNKKWEGLRKDIITFGIRNSHLMAIAPNTSSSLIQGCTASILPTFSRFFYDKNNNGFIPIAPPFVKDAFWYYQENKTLPQNAVVDATSIIQGWIDTGISMELLFNLNEGVYATKLTAKDIFETQLRAWEKGCKAIYYIRSVQKDSLKENSESCSSCSN